MTSDVALRGIARIQLQARDELIEKYLDALDITGSYQEALDAVGRGYESMRRTLKLAGLANLMEDLAEWRREDNQNKRYALGGQWQHEKTDARWT